LWRDIFVSFCCHRKRPAEAGRFCQLRIGIAGLLVRLFGIFVTTAGLLALLAGFLTAALLLTWLLTRCLILLAGLVLVRHVVSFHGNSMTTAQSLRRSDTKEMAVYMRCGGQPDIFG
jgi:hypothetical protein